MSAKAASAPKATATRSQRATSVEDRLNAIEKTLALMVVLTRALEQGDELSLPGSITGPAWAKLSDMCCDALSEHKAIESALHEAEVCCVDGCYSALMIDTPGGEK